MKRWVAYTTAFLPLVSGCLENPAKGGGAEPRYLDSMELDLRSLIPFSFVGDPSIHDLEVSDSLEAVLRPLPPPPIVMDSVEFRVPGGKNEWREAMYALVPGTIRTWEAVVETDRAAYWHCGDSVAAWDLRYKRSLPGFTLSVFCAEKVTEYRPEKRKIELVHYPGRGMLLSYVLGIYTHGKIKIYYR